MEVGFFLKNELLTEIVSFIQSRNLSFATSSKDDCELIDYQ